MIHIRSDFDLDEVRSPKVQIWGTGGVAVSHGGCTGFDWCCSRGLQPMVHNRSMRFISLAQLGSELLGIIATAARIILPDSPGVVCRRNRSGRSLIRLDKHVEVIE